MSPTKYFEASNQVSATVIACGSCAFTAARHSRQKSSGTQGATSMRQPEAPSLSQCCVSESGVPYANFRQPAEFLSSSGRSAMPTQPLYCLSGADCAASKVNQV